ncbi:hypothetical protein N7G274_010360 [Stereocaulon virgatum]|uniref:Uncharacterized protein n=1 Tax=Stereocaulon virgatum TaxID=373712 RepID=A0ABR3ZTT0_9LECA
MSTTNPTSHPTRGTSSSSPPDAPAPKQTRKKTCIKGNQHYESEIQSLHCILASLSVDPEPKLKNAKTDFKKQDYHLRSWARQRRAKLVERLRELESGWIEAESVEEREDVGSEKERCDRAYAEYLARKAKMEAQGRVGK